MAPGKAKTWWVWARTRPDAVVYALAPHRSGAILGAYGGIVMCDGCGAYRTLTRDQAPAARAITLGHYLLPLHFG